jgi:hypothetical protein
VADDSAVAVYVQDDQALIVGADDILDALLAQFAPRSIEPLDGLQRVIDAVVAATGLSSALAEHGGRWVQLTAQSHAWLQEFQAVPGADGSFLGVVRGAHGQFTHTLSFTGANVDPTMLANLHTVGATMALRLAIARLERALDRIDAKIDVLIDGQRATELGEAAGATWILERTYDATDEATQVSDVHWSQVEDLGQLFATMTRRCIEKLKSAERAITGPRIAERYEAANSLVEGDLQSLLGLLALAHRNQLRWQELEIGRLQATEPGRVARHRVAAEGAAAQLQAAVQQQVTAMHQALQQSGSITDWTNTRHPVKARRLVDKCSDAHDLLERFADACDLDCPPWSEPALPLWKSSAVAVADTSSDVAVEIARRAGPVVTPILAPNFATRRAIQAYRRVTARNDPLYAEVESSEQEPPASQEGT